jgi:hypothetical protein
VLPVFDRPPVPPWPPVENVPPGETVPAGGAVKPLPEEQPASTATNDVSPTAQGFVTCDPVPMEESSHDLAKKGSSQEGGAENSEPRALLVLSLGLLGLAELGSQRALFVATPVRNRGHAGGGQEKTGPSVLKDRPAEQPP